MATNEPHGESRRIAFYPSATSSNGATSSRSFDDIASPRKHHHGAGTPRFGLWLALAAFAFFLMGWIHGLMALVFIWRTQQSSSVQPEKPMEYNVIMVSAFLDIGEFGKGNLHNKRDHRIYQQWSSAYSAIHSPLVFYTDSPSFADHMQQVRQKLPNLTKIILVNRTRLWAFQLRDSIAAIYRAGYPVHYPNTVYPDYTCVTHAKFEFIKDAILNSYFYSRHVVWLDVGYFRDMWTQHKQTTAFTMHPLVNLDPKRVMCTQVGAPNFKMAWRQIFWRNINWVSGGFFLATRQVMMDFVLQYQRAVELFLRLNQSQVEQHVLYSIYTDEGRELVKPTIELQPIECGWFDLGFNSLVPINDSSLP